MKKTLSIILALIIAFSTFAFGASAAETNKTEALFAKINDAKEVSVTLRAGDVNLFGFLRTSATDTVYIKGNKLRNKSCSVNFLLQSRPMFLSNSTWTH